MTAILGPALLAIGLVGLALGPAFAAAEEEPSETSERPETTEATDEPEPSDEPAEDAEETDEDREAEEWEDEERDVQAEVDEDGFRVESRRESSRGDDEITAEFEAESARLGLEFQREAPADGESLEMEIHEWRLVEFVDENRDGSFQAGEPVLQSFRPSGMSVQQSLTPQGLRIDAVQALGGSSTWTLSFLVPERGQSLDGLALSATELKFDIAIRAFPYRAADSTVAVQFRYRAQAEFEEGSKGGLPSLQARTGGVTGFLRWVNHSVVDGAVRPVGVGVVEIRFDGEGDGFTSASVVTFSYARGVAILHDPSLGVALAGASGILEKWSDPSWLAFGMVAAVVLVAATLGPRLRIR